MKILADSRARFTVVVAGRASAPRVQPSCDRGAGALAGASRAHGLHVVACLKDNVPTLANAARPRLELSAGSDPACISSPFCAAAQSHPPEQGLPRGD